MENSGKIRASIALAEELRRAKNMSRAEAMELCFKASDLIVRLQYDCDSMMRLCTQLALEREPGMPGISDSDYSFGSAPGGISPRFGRCCGRPPYGCSARTASGTASLTQ